MMAMLAVPTSLAVGSYVYSMLDVSLGLAALTLAITVLMALMMLLSGVLRGSGSVVLGQALDVAIRPGVQLVLIFGSVLLLGGLRPELAVSLSALAILAAMIAGLHIAAKIWRARMSSEDQIGSEQRRAWTRASATMGLTTVLFVAEASIPLILVGTLSGMAEAGIYRVASAAMVLPGMMISLVTVMTAPTAARLFEQSDTQSFRRLAAASCISMAIPTICIAVVLAIFGRTLLHVVFGPEYDAAWLPMMILTACSIVTALGGIGTVLLHAARRESTVSLAFLISLLLCIVVTLLLSPQLGAVGVAIATLAAVTARTAHISVESWRMLDVEPTIFGALRCWLGLLSEKGLR
jgi:O-antigen/teichoic acid export membrane protein